MDGPDTDEKCASDSKQADSKKSSKSLDTIVAAYNALQKRFPPDPSTLLKKVLGAVPGLGQFQWLLDSASGGPSQGLVNGIYASMRYGTRGISIKRCAGSRARGVSCRAAGRAVDRCVGILGPI